MRAPTTTTKHALNGVSSGPQSKLQQPSGSLATSEYAQCIINNDALTTAKPNTHSFTLINIHAEEEWVCALRQCLLCEDQVAVGGHFSLVATDTARMLHAAHRSCSRHVAELTTARGDLCGHLEGDGKRQVDVMSMPGEM